MSSKPTPLLNGHEVRAACVAGPFDPRALRDYFRGRAQRPTTVVRIERGLRAIGRADAIRHQEAA